MKYKFKKGDKVFSLYHQTLQEGIIKKRLKDSYGDNIYYVNIISFINPHNTERYFKEKSLYYRYDDLFDDMISDLIDRLKHNGLKL
jgi:hypothetical protein